MYKVMIKNFVTKKYEIMKLTYDPRNNGEGLAIFKKKENAEHSMKVAMVISGPFIDLKIIKTHP